MQALAPQVTALAPPKLLEKMSELLTQHADPSDRGFCSARLAEAMLPHLDEQEQASFHGVLRRLDTLADALLAKVGNQTPLTLAAMQGSSSSVHGSPGRNQWRAGVVSFKGHRTMQPVQALRVCAPIACVNIDAWP